MRLRRGPARARLHAGDAGADYRLLLRPGGDRVLYLMNGSSYGPAGQTVWSSNTSAAGCPNLDTQEDGNLVLYNQKGAVWSTHTINAELRSVLELTAGERIFSADEQYARIMQSDGNPGYK